MSPVETQTRVPLLLCIVLFPSLGSRIESLLLLLVPCPCAVPVLSISGLRGEVFTMENPTIDIGAIESHAIDNLAMESCTVGPCCAIDNCSIDSCIMEPFPGFSYEKSLRNKLKSNVSTAD